MSSSKDQSVEQRATTYVFPVPDPLVSEAEPEQQLSTRTTLTVGKPAIAMNFGGPERMSVSVSGTTKEFSVPAVLPTSSDTEGTSSVKHRKPPLLKTSSLGLGTSAFGSEGERHRLHNQTPLHPQDNSSTAASSLSNICSSGGSIDQFSNRGAGGSVKFPGSHAAPSGSSTSSAIASGSGLVGSQAKLPRKSALKGHIRSASHGGVIQPSRGVDMGASGMDVTGTKSSVLKKGHTRAASHGQIVEDDPQGLKTHSRAPSKTDFILPPSHKKERERLNSTTVPKESHWRGHSRQASRSESIYTLRQHKTPMKHKLMFWKRPTETDNRKNRVVVPNHMFPNASEDQKYKHPNSDYPNNHIRTTKYTIMSFLPKNLFEQFHRFANLYFISIVLLNWIPLINAFGKEIAMLPVMFVLGVTAIKDLFEDRRRYNSDKRINNSSCRVWDRQTNTFLPRFWKTVRVGDVVHLSCDEHIPADILVLKTSDPNGLCYIETMNLDGESNLKQREVVRGFKDMQSSFDVSKFQSRMELGLPTTKIYHFSGKMIHPNNKEVPLTKENLLLRDCFLKNTDFVEGIVVYAGRETKAMLNNGGPRHKRTGLERLMNLEVVWCVVILAVLCIVGATGSGLWYYSFSDMPVPFLPPGSGDDDSTPISKAFLSFLTFIIILQVMIPLSLYVTIELTKIMQIYHIQNDIELFDPETNKRIECRAMNIPEDLGQIQYVFSDKTGTLTENKMLFRRCTVDAIDYNHADNASIQNIPRDTTSNTPTLQIRTSLYDLLSQPNIQLSVESGNIERGYSGHAEKMREFFLVLAICNTVVVANRPHADNMNADGEVIATESDSQYPRLSPIRESFGSSSQRGSPNVQYGSQDQPTFLEYPSGSSSYQMPSISGAPNILISSNDDSQPQQPLGSLKQSRGRPQRLLHLKQSRPLSPISSSNETTPTESPAQRPRFLQTFPIISKLSKTLQINSPSTQLPTPSSEAKPIFEAESPDELALVHAALAYNCRLITRTPQSLTVAMPGDDPIDYEILHTLPFDSVRKRMSIVVRHPHTNQIILYCKGADSAIFERLKTSDDPKCRDIINRTETQINDYAKEGLRTLVMAKRVLSEIEYRAWLKTFRTAELDLEHRDALLLESYKEMEDHLELVGATGIEDRLQERVPETIEALRKAGIVVWVLTGDKQETAINIAYSCKLFSTDMDIITLNAQSKNSAEKTILSYIKQIENFKTVGYSQNSAAGADHNSIGGSTGHSRRNSEAITILVKKERALVVDGRTLTYILDQKTQLISKFLSLTKYCSSVLCCRATPLQKAFIVTSVKDLLGMRTLAIGDGANDVSMIQRADVGIGISGKEGMQAVMASDFAISKFKYLERLLLVHGHWCYDRLARMILYFFYKNAAFVFVIFWYQLLNGWSGSVMIDQMYLMVFNLFFTALPPMALGIYDQDCPSELLLAYPKLYRQGRLQKVHQAHSFWLNMLDSLYQSVVIFFMSYGAYNGSDVGMFEFGTTIVVACMFTMLVHMAIEAKSWTIIHVLSIVVSIMFFYGFAFIYNTVCISCLGFENPFWVIHELISSPVHWLIVTVTTVLAVLPRLIVRCLENSLFPSDVTKALLSRRQSNKQDAECSVSYSRSTSSSSIFKERMPWICFRKGRSTGISEPRPSNYPHISSVAT